MKLAALLTGIAAALAWAFFLFVQAENLHALSRFGSVGTEGLPAIVIALVAAGVTLAVAIVAYRRGSAASLMLSVPSLVLAVFFIIVFNASRAG
jgi:hypothetical protein